MYFERTNAMQTLWTIYITIVLGILGFLGTVKLRTPRLLILLPLLLAFVAFAVVNCEALLSVTNQRNVAAELVRKASVAEPGTAFDAAVKEEISRSLDPPSVASVAWFHVSADLITLLTMVALGFRERADNVRDCIKHGGGLHDG
jgi:hypothetical protein